MAKQLDPKIGEVLKKHGLGKEACWDCHGTWVVYHWALERVAASARITFDPPQVLEANGKDKCVALAVTGKMDDKSEWSVGEAAPGNNKNAYPYAMAEKRAKDRVVLKLIGLHGLVYSEEEADAFNTGRKVWQPEPNGQPQAQPKPAGPFMGKLTKTKLEAKIREFVADMNAINSREKGAGDQWAGLLTSYKDAIMQCKEEHHNWWNGIPGSDVKGLGERIDIKTAEITEFERNPAPEDPNYLEA